MKFKSFLAVTLAIVTFTACDEDTLNTIKEMNLKMIFYHDGTEITDLKSTIHLNGTGTLTYKLDSVALDALDITAKILETTPATEEVTVYFDSKNNKGTITIASTFKQEMTLEVMAKNNGKVIRTYQFTITNFIPKEEDKRSRISLDVLAGKDGTCNVYIPIRSNSTEYIYELPVFADGLYASEQDLNVNIAINSDTLKEYNLARFGGRNDLYCKQLPETYYSCPSVCHIAEGTNTQKLPIEFKNIVGLDMSNKWVLPVTIKEDPSYLLNMDNKQHKALLSIIPFNDYSGKYNGESCNIYIEPDIDNFISREIHQAYTVDEKTIFFYGGTVDESYADRQKYKIFVRFTDEKIDSQKCKLELWSDNADNNFQVKEQPYYTWKEEMDATDTNLKHIYVTLYVSYTFINYTSIPDYPIEYTVKGTLFMQRTLNTLIPDKDQAIIW